MSLRLLVLAAVAAASLGGCAEQWERPAGTAGRSAYDCSVIARALYPRFPDDLAMRSIEQDRCMRAAGWTKK